MQVYTGQNEAMRIKGIIANFIAWLFICLFVYASVSKLLDFQSFRVDIGKSPMLTAYAAPVAIIVIITELAIASLLAFMRTRLIGLYASFTLMVMFTAYVIAITQFSEYIPCSCGGLISTMTWGQHLVFNSCFVVLGIIGVLFYEQAGQVRIKKNGFIFYKPAYLLNN